MDFDDHSTESEEIETKVYKLLSDTDIQVGVLTKLLEKSEILIAI